MAYRRFGAVAFAVLGWVTVGCGSGGPAGTASSAPHDDTAVPLNPDQPPKNAADTPPNSSQAPSGQAPSGEPQPGQPNQPPTNGGGNLEQLCERFCDRREECPESSEVSPCEPGTCSLTEAQEGLIAPCKSQLTALYSCALSLPSVCSGPGTECTPYVDSLDACFEANGLGDNDSDDGSSTPPPASGDLCTMANSCQCTTACQFCTCYGGTPAACADACAVSP